MTHNALNIAKLDPIQKQLWISVFKKKKNKERASFVDKYKDVDGMLHMMSS